MIPYQILKKKRDGFEISSQEMTVLVQSYLDGHTPEYIMSSFLMAIFFQGMTPKEIAALTTVYIESGIKMNFPGISGTCVDKHSSGGVGDGVTLMLAPIIAACGGFVPMLSGRGLGHTGGTLDKLEAIPGFGTALTPDEFVNIVEKTGVAIAAQSKNLCPADGRIYALRDVTATVESIPLITASIMSKKIAEGTNALILDVKMGSGAFMKSEKQALNLAQNLIAVGTLNGVRTEALLTDMSEPLGIFVGNALEVVEAVKFLDGSLQEKRIYDVTMSLVSNMLVMAGLADDYKSAMSLAKKRLDDGSALEKFAEMIKAQNGNPNVTNDLSLLAKAKETTIVKAKFAGYLFEADTEKIGIASVALGAGRQTIDSIIDPAVGFEIHRKIGDEISIGDPILTIYHNNSDVSNIEAMIQDAYVISEEKPKIPKLVITRIDKNGQNDWELFD